MWGLAVGSGETTRDTLIHFFSINFMRRKKQLVKELVLVMWVQTEERNKER